MELRTVAFLALLLLGAAQAGPINYEDSSSCSTTCNSHTGTNKFKYEVGKTYVYGYQSTSEVLVTEHAGHQLHIRMTAQAEISVVAPCEMVLRLRDVQLTGSGIDDPRAFKQDLEDEELPFGFDDGRITDICPIAEADEEGDDDSALNIKRAILSAFQNSMNDLESPLSIRETDVAGVCLTKYQKASSGWSSMTVSKTKDLSSCVQRHDSTVAIFSSPYLSEDSPIQNLPLLSGRIECYQTVKSKIIEKVDCTEENVFKPFSRNGHGAAIHTKVSLVYRTTEDNASPQYGRFNRRSNLLFAHTPSKFLKADNSDARNILSQICEKSRDIIRPSVPHLFSQLVSILRSLPSSTIKSLIDSANNNEFCPTARDVIIDAMSMTGTEGGVKNMIHLLKNKEVSKARAEIWFTMMAFNTRITEDAVAAIAPLLNDRDIAGRQALLGLSSMVYNFCAKKPSCHEGKAVKDVISVLQRRLGKCRSSNIDEENEIIDVLSAFENIGRVGGAKDDILECASSDSNSNAIRQAAIRALRRVPCGDKIKRKMIDLYTNTNEEPEIRIYAYIAAMRCADEEIVRQIKTMLEKEPVNQVGAYVWTHLTNLQETSIRHKQDIRQIVSDVNLTKKFSGMDFRRFSRNVEWSTFLNKINAGLGIEMDLIYSPKSYVPRNVNLNFTSDLFGQSMHLLGMQTRMEGLEHILETYFGESGYFGKLSLDDILTKLGIYTKHDGEDDESDNKTNRRTNRSSKSTLNKLSLLHERMNIETSRDARISTALTLLGRKIARVTLNDIKELFNIEEAIDVMEILTEMAQHQKVDRSTSVKFIDLEVSTASVSGMQINLAVNGTAMLAIKAEGKFDIRKLLTSDHSADIDGYIKPSGAIEISALMSVRAGTHKPGLKIVSTAHSSAHIQGKLKMKEGRILKVRLDLPREKTEVLTARTDIFTVEANGVEKPVHPPKTRDVNTCGKALGVALCMKMKTPNPLFNEKTPLIPIGGPMSLELTLEKDDRSMQGYELAISVPSEHDYVEKVYMLEFDTPGSRINHHYALESRLSRQKDETILNVKMRTPTSSMMGTGSLLTRPDLLRGRVSVNINNKQHYSLNAEAKIEDRGNQIEYIPSVELQWPNSEPVTLGGSVVRVKGGRKQQLNIDLKSNKPSSKPAYIRGNMAIEGKSRFSTDITVSVPHLETHLHGTMDKQDTVFATDMTLEYQTGRQRRHTVKLTSKGQNLSTRHLTKLSVVSELQLSQLPEANLNVAWEMQYKPLEHYENEINIKYGESMRPIHFLQVSKLEVAKKRGKSENRLLIEAPEIVKDIELLANTEWDIREKPTFHVDANVKYAKSKKGEVSLDYKYKNTRPLEMEVEARLKTPEKEFVYRDTLRERSPNEFEGRTMFQWQPDKRAVVDYTYRMKSDSAKTHHEVDIRLQCPSFSVPLQHKALLRVTREAVDFRSHTQHEGKSVYSINAKLSSVGQSKVEAEILGWKGEMEMENDDLTKTARIELRDSKDKHYTASAKYASDPRGMKHTVDVDVNMDNDTPFKFFTALTSIADRSSPRFRWEGKAKYGDIFSAKLHSEVDSDVVEGPHELTLEIEGRHIEPHSIQISHKIENGAMQSEAKVFKNHDEIVTAEASGKYVRHSSSQGELTGSVSLKSPNPRLNGKQIAFGYKREDKKHVVDLRLQGSPSTPYSLNLEYEGKSGWSSGKHEVKVLLTTPFPKYRSQDVHAIVEYSDQKFEMTSDINMAQGKKLHMAVDIEAQPGRLTGSYEMSTPFATLSSLRVNTLTEFNDNYRTENAIEVNGDRKLAWKGHLNSKDASDLDGFVDIQSKIGPKFDVNVRLIRNPRTINYALVLKKDSFEVFSTKMLHERKSKDESSGLFQMKKGDSVLALDWQRDRRDDGEVTYSIKSRGLGQPMKITASHNEKNNELTSEIRVCMSGRDSDCLVMEGRYKKEDSAYYGTLLRELFVKISQSPDLEVLWKMNLDARKDSFKHSAALSLFGKELGYRIEATVGDRSTGLIKIKMPSRVLKAEGSFVTKGDNSEIKIEILGDAERQPSHKLTIDISTKEVNSREKNLLTADILINHPNMESPIKAVLELESNEGKVLRPISAKMEIDYSTDPSKKVYVVTYVEQPNMDNHNKTVFFNIYQADHKNLDFMWKSHIAVHNDRMTTGYHWHWTSKSRKTEGFSYLEVDHRDKEIHYYYRCPSKNNLDVHGTWNYKPGNVLTVDLNAELNGDPSKMKMIVDIPKPCIEVLYYDEPAGSPNYRFHSCVDSAGKSLLTITSEYFEGEQKINDASFVFDRRSEKTFSAHIHWNPERLGVLMFQMMQVGDALESMEFEKKIEKIMDRIFVAANDVDSEILEPIVKYLGEELSKLITELAADVRHVNRGMKRAYKDMPEIEIYEPVAKFVSEINADMKAYFEDILPDSIKEFLRELSRYIEDASKSVCSYGSSCYQIRVAYQKRGLDGIMELLYTAFANMPDSYYRIAVATKDFLEDKLPSFDMEPVWRAAERTVEKIEEMVKPIVNSEMAKKLQRNVDKLGESVEHLVDDIYETIKEHFDKIFEEFMKNPEIRAISEIILEFYREVVRELRKFPLEKTVEKILDFAEDFFSVDSLHNSVHVISFDEEKGEAQIDIRLPADIKTLRKSFSNYYDDDSDNYNSYNSIQSAVRKEWVPPFRAHAQLVGGRHYKTFDNTFYDFAGECSYLLARDFADGNFTVAIKYGGHKNDGKIDKTIVVVVDDHMIDIDPNEESVTLDEQPVDLPLFVGPVAVMRRGKTFVVDNQGGIQVTCHLVHDYCTTVISGWYFGKTAGLFGTYDNEPSNDFTRPRGKISGVSDFTKSWQLNSGCKHKSLAKDINVDSESLQFQECRRYFRDDASPLRDCFDELEEEQYFNMCVRQVAIQRNSEEAVCTVAAAFVHSCRQHKLSVTLPSVCLKCKSNSGGGLDYGERHTYDRFRDVPQSADVVYIIEERKCNQPVIKDMDSIARLIDRELVNSGYSNNKYAVVAYGGPGGESQPHTHTARGKEFFGVHDVVLATEKIRFQSKRSPVDTFGALRYAIRLHYREAVSKTFVLLTCAACDEEQMSVDYSDIQRLLLDRGITLHILNERSIQVRGSSTKSRGIYAVDAYSVYRGKDISQKSLYGQPDLRSQVAVPKDICIALAQEVNGAFFTTKPLTKSASSVESKNWKSLLARRIAKTAVPHSCQVCDCVADDYLDVASPVCQPCVVPAPKVPITVYTSEEDEYY